LRHTRCHISGNRGQVILPPWFSTGGRASILLYSGDLCEIGFDPNGKGLVSPKIPVPNHLIWEVFDAAVEVVIKNRGKAMKGIKNIYLTAKKELKCHKIA
jgi:hypothetical protein